MGMREGDSLNRRLVSEALRRIPDINSLSTTQVVTELQRVTTDRMHSLNTRGSRIQTLSIRRVLPLRGYIATSNMVGNPMIF